MRGRFHLMRITDAARRAEERRLRMLDMESVSHKGPFFFQLGRIHWDAIAVVAMHLGHQQRSEYTFKGREKSCSELFQYHYPSEDSWAQMIEKVSGVFGGYKWLFQPFLSCLSAMGSCPVKYVDNELLLTVLFNFALRTAVITFTWFPKGLYRTYFRKCIIYMLYRCCLSG